MKIKLLPVLAGSAFVEWRRAFSDGWFMRGEVTTDRVLLSGGFRAISDRLHLVASGYCRIGGRWAGLAVFVLPVCLRLGVSSERLRDLVAVLVSCPEVAESVELGALLDRVNPRSSFGGRSFGWGER